MPETTSSVYLSQVDTPEILYPWSAGDPAPAAYSLHHFLRRAVTQGTAPTDINDPALWENMRLARLQAINLGLPWNMSFSAGADACDYAKLDKQVEAIIDPYARGHDLDWRAGDGYVLWPPSTVWLPPGIALSRERKTC